MTKTTWMLCKVWWLHKTSSLHIIILSSLRGLKCLLECHHAKAKCSITISMHRTWLDSEAILYLPTRAKTAVCHLISRLLKIGLVQSTDHRLHRCICSIIHLSKGTHRCRCILEGRAAAWRCKTRWWRPSLVVGTMALPRDRQASCHLAVTWIGITLLCVLVTSNMVVGARHILIHRIWPLRFQEMKASALTDMEASTAEIADMPKT